jgi:hypothetical protein
MNLKSIFWLFLLSLLISVPVFSQGEIDDEKKIFYRDEKSWAFFINNNGFGGNFRKGTRINAFRKFIWEVDMHYVKHAKEIKISNSATQLNQFVYGKMHFAWDIRGGAGFQREMFRKIDKNGVAIRYFYNVGPTLMLLKPIYYEVVVGDEIEDQKFDYGASQYIVGRSSFFKGFDEIGVDPGAYVRGGLSFEYSKRDNRLQALEIGAMAGVYLNEFEIMYDNKTRYLFTLFISFRWGKIIRGGRMKGVELEGDEP